MSIVKVIEISASSTKNFEDAIKRGIAKASKSVDGITGAWVNEEKVKVTNGEVTEWRVNMRVSFVVGADD